MFKHQDLDDIDSADADELSVKYPETDDDAAAAGPEFATLPRARTNIEAVMGLLAAFFIGIPALLFAVGAVTFILAAFLDPIPLMIAAGLTLVGSGYLCVTVVRLAAKAIEGEGSAISFSVANGSANSLNDEPANVELFLPLALAMAIRLPTWWWTGTRPLIALWWLGHFIAAAIFGHMAARQLIGVNNPALVAVPIALAVNLAFLFAANLYLMLAIAVGIPRPRFWLIAWKYRLFFDLVITFATIASS